MRIGVATDFYYPWIGGPSTLLRNLTRGLVARGHEVFLLAPSADGVPGEQEESGVSVTRVRTLPIPVGYNMRVALAPSAARRWLHHVSPDVVHYHHPFPLSASVALAARVAGIPLVATNHTIPECSLWGVRHQPALYRVAHAAMTRWLLFILSQSDVVVTPTETASHLLRELGFDSPITPISNGIDTQKFAPGPPPEHLRSRFGLDHRPVVLYTGRLDAEKEMDVWLRAASRTAGQVDAVFLIGGEGTAKPQLQRLARDIGLSHRTHFIGYLDDDDYASLYRLADVYMMMSPVELQSISTLEAVASGLPVVAVSAGALPELVCRDNGALVGQGDWREAGNALARILRDAPVRVEMGQRSRSVALAHDMRISVERYETIFEEAIAARKGRNRAKRARATGY